jgi:hypothetical protein
MADTDADPGARHGLCLWSKRVSPIVPVSMGPELPTTQVTTGSHAGAGSLIRIASLQINRDEIVFWSSSFSQRIPCFFEAYMYIVYIFIYISARD